MIYGDFQWWIGTVEDVNDPEKIGRYRVRILGFHTSDKSILATEDSPTLFLPTSSSRLLSNG